MFESDPRERARKTAQIEADRKRAFDAFMEQSSTRMFLSLIPPNPDQPDALRVLLQSAFEAGFSQGAVSVMISFMETIAKEQR